MPTGAGKTFTALEVVVDVMRLPRSTSFIVWLVDSNELAEQALESFTFLWKLKGDRPLAVCRLFNKFCPAFEDCREGGVVFASFDKLHSILSDVSHRDRAHVSDLLKRTDILIVDEAHGSIARTYSRSIEAFADAAPVRIIGLTATPGRPDPTETSELANVFSMNLIGIKDPEGNLLEDPIHFLQQEGFLAVLDCELLETGVTLNEADEQRICRQLAENSDRNGRILDQMEQAHHSGESTVVFACTLDHVFALKVLCNKRMIPCEVIVGETPQQERLRILDRFRNREFFILINLDILSTGVDLPKLQKMILTRPIGSPVLYSQVLGRALRGPKNGGNARNKIVNLRDNLLNFPSANLLYTHFWEDWIRH
jgi:superfamily II DNA or RNA helicase